MLLIHRLPLLARPRSGNTTITHDVQPLGKRIVPAQVIGQFTVGQAGSGFDLQPCARRIEHLLPANSFKAPFTLSGEEVLQTVGDCVSLRIFAAPFECLV